MVTPGDRSASWLSALVAPIAPDLFLRRYWGAEHLFCRGAADRYAALLSWSELNGILERHWRELYRFRLALQGRDLEPASYADVGGFTPRVRARDVTEFLRRGATLSFDAIDELHPPLTRLAESFEACFRGGTKINIYAGWRTLHGLDLHRDNQEIFILQLDGRKRWLLYGFSVDGIDAAALRRESIPPAGAALDEVLHPGDLLYIPRGCYHVALPLNEPTLHLTIGVKVPRVADMLAWIAARPAVAAIADADLPTLADAARRVHFSDRVRKAITATLRQDLVEQYLNETGSNLKPRPSFSLPHSATAEGLPLDASFVVRLNPPLPTRSSSANSDIWHCGARTYRFPPSMESLFDRLGDAEPHSFRSLIAAPGSDLDEASLRFLLGMLVREGLVTVRPEPAVKA